MLELDQVHLDGTAATAMTGGNAYGNAAVAIGIGSKAATDTIAIGNTAGQRATGTKSVFIGTNAGDVAAGAKSSGDWNTAIGFASLYNGGGAENTYFGAYSGNRATGSHN